MKLYELSQKYYEALESAIDTESGEIRSEDLFEQLNQIADDLENKVLDIACLIKDIDADSEKLKAEEERLKKRRKALENKSEYLRAYIQSNIPEGKKYENERAKIAWKKSTKTICDLKEEELIRLRESFPELVKVKYEPALTEMKKYIEVTPIEGITNLKKYNLQIG